MRTGDEAVSLAQSAFLIVTAIAYYYAGKSHPADCGHCAVGADLAMGIDAIRLDDSDQSADRGDVQFGTAASALVAPLTLRERHQERRALAETNKCLAAK